jgi:hypothetical protein
MTRLSSFWVDVVSATESVDPDGKDSLQVGALETIDAAATELGEPLCSEEEECALC